MRYLKGLSNLVNKIYLQKDCHYKLSSYELNYLFENKILSLSHYGTEILCLKQLDNNVNSNKQKYAINNLYFQSQSDLNAINTVIAT